MSGRRVDSFTFAPSPALRDVVDYYWVTAWDLRDQPPHVVELLADPSVHLAFGGGESRVVGVCTRLWRRELTGQGRIRAVKLRPGAARALLDGPVIALTDQVRPLRTTLPTRSTAELGELERGVLDTDDHQQALAHLDHWLLGRMTQPFDSNVTLAVKLVDHIARHEELTSAAQVAAASGLSLRPLQRLFRDHVGASPKWVIRRVRLQEAALRLERGTVTSLATLAAELGYSDHAHLSRDFKNATGRSPREFAASVWK